MQLATTHSSYYGILWAVLLRGGHDCLFEIHSNSAGMKSHYSGDCGMKGQRIIKERRAQKNLPVNVTSNQRRFSPVWEMISRWNTRCDGAAVALITKVHSTWKGGGAQVLLAAIRHTLSRCVCVWGGKMNAPVFKTKYPPVPLVSPSYFSPNPPPFPHVSISLYLR